MAQLGILCTSMQSKDLQAQSKALGPRFEAMLGGAKGPAGRSCALGSARRTSYPLLVLVLQITH
jgi:hypothetical protein